VHALTLIRLGSLRRVLPEKQTRPGWRMDRVQPVANLGIPIPVRISGSIPACRSSSSIQRPLGHSGRDCCRDRGHFRYRIRNERALPLFRGHRPPCNSFKTYIRGWVVGYVGAQGRCLELFPASSVRPSPCRLTAEYGPIRVGRPDHRQGGSCQFACTFDTAFRQSVEPCNSS
jgi:hypothetical protein